MFDLLIISVKLSLGKIYNDSLSCRFTLRAKFLELDT